MEKHETIKTKSVCFKIKIIIKNENYGKYVKKLIRSLRVVYTHFF